MGDVLLHLMQPKRRKPSTRKAKKMAPTDGAI
jgi:hypothetical protein